MTEQDAHREQAEALARIVTYLRACDLSLGIGGYEPYPQIGWRDLRLLVGLAERQGQEMVKLRERHAEEVERLENEHAACVQENIVVAVELERQRHTEAVEAAWKAGRRDGIGWVREVQQTGLGYGIGEDAAWLASATYANVSEGAEPRAAKAPPTPTELKWASEEKARLT